MHIIIFHHTENKAWIMFHLNWVYVGNVTANQELKKNPENWMTYHIELLNDILAFISLFHFALMKPKMNIIMEHQLTSGTLQIKKRDNKRLILNTNDKKR